MLHQKSLEYIYPSAVERQAFIASFAFALMGARVH